jgi:hypothetical protein
MRILLPAFSISSYSGEKASFNLSFSPEGLDSSSNFLFQLRANPDSQSTCAVLNNGCQRLLAETGVREEGK